MVSGGGRALARCVVGLNGRLRVLAVACASALNPVRNMPFRWALNPYRGCSHACKYCYARITHEYLGFNSAGDFERILLAKVDAPEKLARELARPGWRRELVAVGTATDPYQPVEGRLQLTARCLEVFRRFATPVSLVTKSTLVLRDAGRLAALAAVAPGTMVWVTVTTLDARLARQLEPGAPPPAQRLRAIARLSAQEVPVGVLVAPVLPGVTDGPDQLPAVVRAACLAGAVDVRMGVLRLCEGAREVYGGWMGQFRPELAGLYRRLYGGGLYPARRYVDELQARFEELRAQAGLTQREPAAQPVPGRPSRAQPLAMQLTFAW